MAPDISDQEPENRGVGQEPAQELKGRPSFSRVLRPLTDDEMSASGVHKLLVAEIDRLEEENGELKAISRAFGDSQQRIGVLEEKLKRHTAFDVISGGCITVGGVALGAIPALSPVPPYGLVAAGLGHNADRGGFRITGGETEMKVRVDRIRDPGILDQERLVLRVLATTDIGDYALLRTRYDAETVLAGNCDAFWFPFRPVYKDDLVVVYTKPGVMKEKLLEDGAKAHFFYWGLEYPIWNADDRGAVILYAPTWKDNHQQHLMRPRSASATT